MFKAMEKYDLIIIGGGPAGLTAGLYAARARLKSIMFERISPGGQVLNTEQIDNYPGFSDGIAGWELVDNMTKQAEKFGLQIVSKEVESIDISTEWQKVNTSDKESTLAKTVIISTGAIPKHLNIPGEKEFTGKGISFCATCDGAFYRGLDVAVIGGGDAAVEEAIFLTKFSPKVSIIHRRDQLRATKILQEKAMANGKINFIWDTIPVAVKGENEVESIKLKNVKTDKESELFIKGIFLYVGINAATGFLPQSIKKDKKGFIITNDKMETNIPGVFAAGDCRSKILRQVSTAVGEGATAAFAAEKYIEGF